VFLLLGWGDGRERMDTTWLSDFLALAEHQKFSRAAEARNVTQPAFSRRIQALENWVGTPLFDRSTHTVSLTKAGEAFRRGAEEAHRILLQSREAAREEGGVYEPTVRFVATHALALTFFSPWIRTILADRKKPFKIQLVADNMAAAERLMIGGEANLLLCHYHPSMGAELSASQFRSLCIAHDKLIPVSAPDPAGAPLFSLDSDKKDPIPHLAYGEQSGLGRILRSFRPLQSHPVRLRTVFTSHMATVLAAVARDGSGVAWLPRSLVEAELASGALVRAGGPKWDAPIQIELFRPRSRQNPAAEVVWSIVAEHCRGSQTRPGAPEDEEEEVT
jgi:LysR family transcriptional regulator, hypochlorite-specific transcription factor HypT